jgi:pimeloyl-ACP methyl ester carboxylesterase
MVSRFVPLRILGLAALVGLAAAVAGPAQPPAKDKDAPKMPADPNKFRVPIQTADYVELDGTYYRGNKGRDTPCVILVHKFGSDRTKSGLDELARALNNEGFAVLTFDLRGHGGSINVSPSFWGVAANKNGIMGGTAKQTTISFAKFKPTYLPWLINDIAAARKFLEIKNDAGELNAQSIFIVGCGEGASLGMAFVASEWQRQYLVGVRALQSQGTAKVAGRDIAGGVWLSIVMRPNNIFFPMTNWVRNLSGLRNENPMCFIFGDKDQKAKGDAFDLLRALAQGSGGRDKLHKLDTNIELKGTDLASQALLAPAAASFGVPQSVVAYIKKVMADRKAIPWSDFDSASNPLALVNLSALGLSAP